MTNLRASAGDRYIVLPRGAGQYPREAVVLDVRGAAGAPPYVVQWCDDATVETLEPTPDALVLHYEHARRPAAAPR